MVPDDTLLTSDRIDSNSWWQDLEKAFQHWSTSVLSCGHLRQRSNKYLFGDQCRFSNIRTSWIIKAMLLQKVTPATWDPHSSVETQWSTDGSFHLREHLCVHMWVWDKLVCWPRGYIGLFVLSALLMKVKFALLAPLCSPMLCCPTYKLLQDSCQHNRINNNHISDGTNAHRKTSENTVVICLVSVSHHQMETNCLSVHRKKQIWHKPLTTAESASIQTVFCFSVM